MHYANSVLSIITASLQTAHAAFASEANNAASAQERQVAVAFSNDNGALQTSQGIAGQPVSIALTRADQTIHLNYTIDYDDGAYGQITTDMQAKKRNTND